MASLTVSQGHLVQCNMRIKDIVYTPCALPCLGKKYIEVREYKTRRHCVRFYFVTRVYYDYIESILQDMLTDPTPDFVYMSSCCWDVTRYCIYSAVTS